MNNKEFLLSKRRKGELSPLEKKARACIQCERMLRPCPTCYRLRCDCRQWSSIDIYQHYEADTLALRPEKRRG